MATVVATYAFAVQPGSWVFGPIFRPGESVRIQANGFVLWGGHANYAVGNDRNQDAGFGATQYGDGTAWEVRPGGPGIAAVSLAPGATSKTLRDPNGFGFVSAIPPGDQPTGLTLRVIFGTDSGVGLTQGTTIPIVATALLLLDGETIFTLSGPVSGTDLTGVLPLDPAASFDVSKLAWRVTFTNPTATAYEATFVDIVAYVHTRTPAAPTPPSLYAYPEGTYPPDFAAIGYGDDYGTAYGPAYDPSAVLSPSAWSGDPLVCPGGAPLSLQACVVPDGSSPPFASTPLTRGPGRDATLAPRDLLALGASDPEITYRLWFVVNDALDALNDTGGYSVRIDRLRNTTMASEPLVSLISPRFGPQATLGTQAPATRRFGCIADKGVKIDPDQTWEDRGTAGFGYKTGSDLVYDVSKGDVTLNLDTLDTGYILYSAFGGETVTQLAAGVYQHVFEFSPFSQAVAQMFSLELPTEATEMTQATLDLIFNGLKVATQPSKRPTASTSILAGKLAIDAIMSAGQNSVQVVTVNGGPTGGTFVLLDGNKPSGTIAYTNATTAAAVQTAVQALASYGAATVSGAAGGPFTITNPTGVDQRPLVPSYETVGGANTLTGGVSPTVTNSVTNPGGMPIRDAAVCLAQSWTIAVAPTWAQLENAPVYLSDNFSTEVTIGERFERKWVQGAPTGTYRYAQKDGESIADSLALEMAFLPQVRQFIAASRSGQRMAARLRSMGGAIGATGYNRSLTFDMDGQAKWPNNSDSDNVRSIKVTFDALYNLTSGTMLRVTLTNEVPSYSV